MIVSLCVTPSRFTIGPSVFPVSIRLSCSCLCACHFKRETAFNILYLLLVRPAMFPGNISTLEFQPIRELTIWVLIQTSIPIEIRFKSRRRFLVLKIPKRPSGLEFRSSYWLRFLMNALSMTFFSYCLILH